MDRKYREYWLSEREEESGAGMIQWVKKRWQGRDKVKTIKGRRERNRCKKSQKTLQLVLSVYFQNY